MTTDITRPHAKNLRRGRYSQSGYYYLITAVAYNRLPYFTSLACARAVIKAMHSADVAGCCETEAWVLMPDHLHWLFVLRESDISGLIARMKQTSSSKINRLTGQCGQPIWQRGYHDHALRQEENVAGIGRYIVANPLRAGLVDHIGDYPYWDAVWL